ncbi:hypothetical protein Nepgr_005450 [Nepenthes gracilis]|uniref:Uncharacterized protein n=1 Tax=Nepenthes gracilis TaxID=150966 RepID=A0AAD3S3C6_NEPGR|nr:hypothetical protein Nepgr_005450 [Nepenthes gracilis]
MFHWEGRRAEPSRVSARLRTRLATVAISGPMPLPGRGVMIHRLVDEVEAEQQRMVAHLREESKKPFSMWNRAFDRLMLS